MNSQTLPDKTQQDIEAQILVTLAEFYEDPFRRKQYKLFEFRPDDKEKAAEVIARLERNSVVEQIQPSVVRMTDFGFKIVKHDLPRLRRIAAGEDVETQEETKSALLAPTPEELRSFSNDLSNADCFILSRIRDGRLEVTWASDGFEQVTGYTLTELNRLGGTVVLLRDALSVKLLEELARELIEGRKVRGKMDILTKSGEPHSVRFVSVPRYDRDGRIVGTLSAVRDLTANGL